FGDEAFKPCRQLLTRRRAAVNEKPIAESLRLVRRQRPVTERRNVRIDQPLLVSAPAGRMVRIGWMIENRDAESFASKRPLDVAPRGALLFAFTAAQPVRVQVCLAWIGFVPRHTDRHSTDEKFAEGHALFFRAQQ